MPESKDWLRWHDSYDDPASPLARRLRVVQTHIARWLDERAGDAVLRVVSACAGQGRDLIGVLAERPRDALRVRALLVELDPRNVAAARANAAAAGLDGVTVREADAGRVATYLDAVPADLVMLCGVFGNVPAADVERTVRATPQLCASGATVMWTRSRKAPDLTPTIRRWFEDAGFEEVAFDAPGDVSFSVGVCRMVGPPARPDASQVLFDFAVD